MISTVARCLYRDSSAGDIDGDGDTEIVVAGIMGDVYVWHHDGSIASGFPFLLSEEILQKWVQIFVMTKVWVADFFDPDEDGTMELIAAGLDSRLYVWEHDGSEFGPYPVDVCAPKTVESKEEESLHLYP